MSQPFTILIVDDQLSAREVLRGLLTGRGYNLVFAENGPSGLAQAIELLPDLVILDVMMPGMDGFEVCQHLRADPRLVEVPILMVTALDDRASRLQGIRVGADDFISKPFDQTELQLRVGTIIKLNRYRRLHAERAKFEWVVEKASDGYLIITRDDHLIYANDQARHYLGLSPNGTWPVTQTFLDLARGQYNSEPATSWVGWPEPTDLPLYLVRPASPSDHSLWLQVDRLELPAAAGEKYLIQLRDVTTVIATRQDMWTFQAQVGHKLRTPVTLITGFLDLLQQESVAFSCKHQDWISSAYDSSTRLRDEIQDVLQYLNTPALAGPHAIPCSLSHVAAIIAEIQAGLQLEQVQLTYNNITDPDHTCLPLSRQAVELILQELLENAQKFHPSQAPTTTVEITETPSGLCLQVSDDGLTLPPDKLAKMWVPYYQVEKYFTGQVNGMGLGLAIVASLVWETGGTCRAYNRLNNPGLTIELIFPARVW